MHIPTRTSLNAARLRVLLLILLLVGMAGASLTIQAMPPAQATLTPTTFVTAAAPGSFQRALLNQPIRGRVAAANQADRFALFGRAGDVISVGVFPEAGDSSGAALIPQIALFTPAGEQAAAAVGGANAAAAGGALISGYTLPATGAYILFLRGANGSTGEYALLAGESWTLRELPGGPLTFEATVGAAGTGQATVPQTGELLRAGDRQTWTLDLPQNATLSVEVAAEGGGLNPVIEIVSPDGAQLEALRGGPGGTVIVPGVVTPAPGRYLLRVTAFVNESVGRYRITARVIGIIPTPTFGPVTGP